MLRSRFYLIRSPLNSPWVAAPISRSRRVVLSMIISPRRVAPSAALVAALTLSACDPIAVQRLTVGAVPASQADSIQRMSRASVSRVANRRGLTEDARQSSRGEPCLSSRVLQLCTKAGAEYVVFQISEWKRFRPSAAAKALYAELRDSLRRIPGAVVLADTL